jgi:hypothetical protein
LLKQWDLNPPALHFFAHIALQVIGKSAVALRFPSMLEFYVAGIMVLWYLRRKVGMPFAVAGVLMVWYSPVFYYATEARPYALICMCFACLLLAWDIAATAAKRGIALCGVALSSTGLVAAHVFGPLSVLPFVAAEIARWHRRRVPDYPLWAALLVPCLGIAAYVPLYENYENIDFYPPRFQASLWKIATFYWRFLHDWSVNDTETWHGAALGLCVAFAAAWIACRGRFRWASLRGFRRDEVALFAVAIGNPVLLNLILMPSHAAFWPRYCITSALALCIAFTLVLATISTVSARAGAIVSCALLVLVTLQELAMPMYERAVERSGPANGASLSGQSPDLPIVAASGLTFIEMQQYERPSVTSRLYYLEDRQAAIRYAHATMFDDLETFVKQFHLRGTVLPYSTFVSDHRAFLVLGTPNYPEDWLLKKLSADGAKISSVASYPIPYKDRTLYFVTFAGQARTATD